MVSCLPLPLAHDRTWVSACAVRARSALLLCSLDSMSKSRWLTLNVVTTDSTCVAIAAADEHWAPRSVASVSTVYPPKETLTSPPSAWSAETCDCQPDWFGSDHWQLPPLTKARVKNWVPSAAAAVVSVVLLSPVSTYGAKTCAGQTGAARAIPELPRAMTTPVAGAAPTARAMAAGSSERRALRAERACEALGTWGSPLVMSRPARRPLEPHCSA